MGLPAMKNCGTCVTVVTCSSLPTDTYRCDVYSQKIGGTEFPTQARLSRRAKTVFAHVDLKKIVTGAEENREKIRTLPLSKFL
jgi:hypothetical protein